MLNAIVFIVASLLGAPACPDDGPHDYVCVWIAPVQGNHLGTSFINIPER